MRQVALFAGFALSIACVARSGAHAQTPDQPRDSLIYAACIPVYVDEFEQKGSEEQRARLMASLLCQMVSGGCQKEPRGEPCKKSIRHLSENLEKSGQSLTYMAA